MVEEHHRRSPFAPPDKTEEHQKDEQKGDTSALINRVGFGAPEPTKPSLDADKERTRVPEKRAEQPTVPFSRLDTQSVYAVRNLIAQAEALQKQLIETCFDKQPNGGLKPKPDTEMISDGNGGKVSVEAMRASILGQMSAAYETATITADKAMKDPDAVFAATAGVRKQHDDNELKIQSMVKQLADQGIRPGVDVSLIDGYVKEHKELNSAQKDMLNSLKESVNKREEFAKKYQELVVMQGFPTLTRQIYAGFLRDINMPGVAKAYDDEAQKITAELNTPAGRSEFMRRQSELTRQASEDALDKDLVAKYVKNADNPYALLESAAKKAKAGDNDAARSDLEKARSIAAKGFPDLDKDYERLEKRGEQLKAEREAFNKKAQEGMVTPYQLMLQREKEMRFQQEATLLDSYRLAKSKVDFAYAGFLLNNDKDKDSESNRKFARDILLGIRSDKLGKLVAMQEGKEFDELFERALNGRAKNSDSLDKFNKLMQEAEELKKKAAEEKSDDAIKEDFAQARKKYEEAAKAAAGINRDAADENQSKIKSELQKQIDAEMAKPASERDQGKVKLMQAILKPDHLKSAEDKALVDSMIECMKPSGADQAKVDRILGMLKDKSALFDAVSSYSIIQQMEFQKQALNNARLAMLDLDVAAGKGENNPLVAEIERDKYGASIIATLDAAPGHDGRSAWGDVKEATRELGMFERAWRWSKGTLKEISIALVSWGAGALAALGVGALTSWSGPGAVVAGGAAGFAAGAAAGHLMRKYVYGDDVKLLSLNTVLDGVSGMTGGVAGSSYAAFRGAGTSAMKNVIAQQAERGVTIGASETWAAFKAAGVMDKMRIATGATTFRASFASATLSSAAYRLPTEALVGNHQNVGDWASASAKGMGMDAVVNLMGARFLSGPTSRIEGQLMERMAKGELTAFDKLMGASYQAGMNRSAYNSAVARQFLLRTPFSNQFLFNSNIGRDAMNGAMFLPYGRMFGFGVPESPYKNENPVSDK